MTIDILFFTFPPRPFKNARFFGRYSGAPRTCLMRINDFPQPEDTLEAVLFVHCMKQGVAMNTVLLTEKDALIVIDVQNDFLSGGSLAVATGDEVISVLNHYIALFSERGLPIYVTRDWHPENHCSFKPYGGMWPPHCIANTHGAHFCAALTIPHDAVVVSKATKPDDDAYSDFDGTGLENDLWDRHIDRIFVGGIATDYCVLSTVMDGLRLGFKVMLLVDAIRAVNVHAGDGQKAIDKMTKGGAIPIALSDIGTGISATEISGAEEKRVRSKDNRRHSTHLPGR